MKKTIYLILNFMAILVIACNNPKKDAKENPYEGAWEMIYSKQIFPDTIIEKTQFDYPTVKLFTKKHYAFGRQVGVHDIYGGGGEYTFDGDILKDYPKYHSSKMTVIGTELVWKSKFDGDLWTMTFSGKVDSVQVEATETWKRIRE